MSLPDHCLSLPMWMHHTLILDMATTMQEIEREWQLDKKTTWGFFKSFILHDGSTLVVSTISNLGVTAMFLGALFSLALQKFI